MLRTLAGLHFTTVTAFRSNAEAQAERARHDNQTGKHLDPRRYMPLYAQAANRARQLEAMHTANQTVFPNDNPSSGMHQLIASVTR